MQTTIKATVLAGLLAQFASAQGESDRAEPTVELALGLERAFTSVIERITPSLVTVNAYVREEPTEPTDESAGPRGWTVMDAQNRYPGFRRLGSASGFVYAEGGYVLTAWHALLKPDRTPARVVEIETHDNRYVLCRVIGGEPTINVAVLQPEVVPAQGPPALQAAPIGDSDLVRPGHWAIALGDPHGALRTCTTGIISAVPLRQCYQGDMTATFLQASLTAHPEAYGGPVVNIHGHVIGQLMPRYPDPLAVPGSGSPGIEFLMPIKIVENIADSLVEASKAQGRTSVRSPWLGFSVIEIPTVRARLRRDDPAALKDLKTPPTGVYIDDVFAPSPATTAGIEVGDYLTSIDGNRLFSVLDFQKWMYLSGVGRKVKLALYRDGATREIEAEIAARPASVRPR